MDATTPAFPQLVGRDVIVFDGVCVLCSGFMRFVISRDSAQRFRFIVAQSPLGEALYAHHGLKSGDYDTNLVFLDGVLYEKFDAFLAVMQRLGSPWRALGILHVLPIGAKNWLYDRIARNRYAWFGRRDRCIVPDTALRARFLE